MGYFSSFCYGPSSRSQTLRSYWSAPSMTHFIRWRHDSDENGNLASRVLSDPLWVRVGEKGNNTFARASRSFVHFFAVVALLLRESSYFHVFWRVFTARKIYCFSFSEVV